MAAYVTPSRSSGAASVLVWARREVISPWFRTGFAIEEHIPADYSQEHERDPVGWGAVLFHEICKHNAPNPTQPDLCAVKISDS